MSQQDKVTLRIALCQLAVGSDKEQNLQRAKAAIQQAAREGKANIIVLPECFNCPYGNKYFPEYAEDLSSTSTSRSMQIMSETAKECGVFLIAGSIPERDGERLYNTSLTFDRSGNVVAKHRKVHLFDINVPGKIVFQESLNLSPGDSLTTFDTEYCKVGVGICFDVRFAEMAQIYQRRGCKLLIYPGAFNMTTGPAHWELLARARAVDNQVFVAMCGPARDEHADYIAWGHSLVVDPWGRIIAETDEREATIYADIDLGVAEDIRMQIPVLKQKRLDLYDVVDKSQQQQQQQQQKQKQ